MDMNHLKAVMRAGDSYGSSLREILEYAGVTDNDLSKITNEQADEWLARRIKNDRKYNNGNQKLQH